MSVNIYVDSFGGNYVGAVAKDGKVLEYRLETANKTVAIGSVFKGRVENVLAGMNAAFVNVGLNRNGYLAAGDMLMDRSELVGSVEMPSILNLKPGDEIIVQAIKDPAGNKGVRLTSNISFAGRYVVFMPTISFYGVSRKITDEESRARLMKIAAECCPKKMGIIIRTAGEHVGKAEIKRETAKLKKRYETIQKQFRKQSAPSLLYEEGNLALRIIRDIYTEDIDKFIVGDRETYKTVLEYARNFETELKSKLILYDKKADMFRYYGLDADVSTLLSNNVAMKSGAYLVIDKTEALTVIDVNTGGFVGDADMEKTAFDTNIEAAAEIARQLRLRNIAGIIVVDFIDMKEEEHKKKLLEVLSEKLAADREKCAVIGMSPLGLVEITRKKKRRESASSLVQSCPYCQGTGTIQSNDYVVMRIRAGLLDLFANGYDNAIVDCNVDIAEYIFARKCLKNDIEKIWTNKRIYVIPHKTYHRQFFLMKGDNDFAMNVPDKAKLLY